jgi:hypothetical protein
MIADNEEQAMKSAKGFAKPYVLRDFEFRRAAPDGTYWQAADGMVVQVAAPERCHRLARQAEVLDTLSPPPAVSSAPVGAR